MVAIRRDRPSKETRDLHLRIINANFDQFAVEAYKGFKAHGRGLLVIDESDFRDKPPGIEVTFKMLYMAEGTAEFLKVVGPHELTWFQKEPKGKLYNPEVSMCVTFLRGDDGISSYNVMGLGERTPLKLWERREKK
jgi:hypothetical protein